MYVSKLKPLAENEKSMSDNLEVVHSKEMTLQPREICIFVGK